MTSQQHNDRAVSPVVGVAILVGITVILASVVGAFVFGLVDIGQSSPDASFTFERTVDRYSTTKTNVTTTDRRMIVTRVLHNSGESIDTRELLVKVSGNQSEPQSNESVYWIDYNGDDNFDDTQEIWNASRGDAPEFVSPGDSRRISVYGVDDSTIGSAQLWDYNVSPTGVAGTGKSPPGARVAFGGHDIENDALGYKLGNCDVIEIVWRSPAGDRGQVLQTYRLPGAQCT